MLLQLFCYTGLRVSVAVVPFRFFKLQKNEKHLKKEMGV